MPNKTAAYEILQLNLKSMKRWSDRNQNNDKLIIQIRNRKNSEDEERRER